MGQNAVNAVQGRPHPSSANQMVGRTLSGNSDVEAYKEVSEFVPSPPHGPKPSLKSKTYSQDGLTGSMSSNNLRTSRSVDGSPVIHNGHMVGNQHRRPHNHHIPRPPSPKRRRSGSLEDGEDETPSSPSITTDDRRRGLHSQASRGNRPRSHIASTNTRSPVKSTAAPQSALHHHHQETFPSPPSSNDRLPKLDCSSLSNSPTDSDPFLHSSFLASLESMDREKTETDTVAARVESVFVVPKGELECIASGFVSFEDYAKLALVLKKLSGEMLCDEENEATVATQPPMGELSLNSGDAPTPKGNSTSAVEGESFCSNPMGTHPREELPTTDWVALRHQLMKFSIGHWFHRGGGEMYSVAGDNVLTKSPSQCMGGEALDNSSFVPHQRLSVDDLITITEKDEALDVFFKMTRKRMPDIQQKLKVMRPSAVLEFSLYHSTAHAQESSRWALHEGSSITTLTKQTMHVSADYFGRFVRCLPPDINAILGHNYLCPTVPLLSPLVTCGVHSSRRREFFVSLEDRLQLLNGEAADCDNEGRRFSSPEEILLSIAMLSNFASNIISAFSLAVVLGCAAWIRKCRAAGNTKIDIRVEEDGTPLQVDGMEQFAFVCCRQFNELSHSKYDQIRRRFPNVFVLSSLLCDDTDQPSTLGVGVSMLMKLIFLFAGGVNSISADDRTSTSAHVSALHAKGEAGVTGLHSRTASNSKLLPITEMDDLPDDVGLSAALHVNALSRFMLLGRMMGLDGKTGSEEMRTMENAKVCAAAWKVVFQYTGVLPHGKACPKDMIDWIKIFPLYAVDDEAKGTLLHVHALIAKERAMRIGPVLRERALSSASALISQELQRMRAAEIAAAVVERMKSPDDSIGGVTMDKRFSMFSVSPRDSVCTSNSNLPIAQLNISEATSVLLCPTFTSARGVANIGDGRGARKELFELCAACCTSHFLPTVDITKDVHFALLRGDISTVHPSKLADGSAKENLVANYSGRAVMVLSWRKRHHTHPDEGTEHRVLHVGDELTFDTNGSWSETHTESMQGMLNADHHAKSSPSVQARSGLLSILPSAMDAAVQNYHQRSRQAASGRSLSVSRRHQAHSPSEKTTHSPFRRSQVVASDRACGGSGDTRSTTASVVTASTVGEEPIYRYEVVAIVAAADAQQHFVIVDAPEWSVTKHETQALLRHPRANPPFSMLMGEGSTFAWTNTDFSMVENPSGYVEHGGHPSPSPSPAVEEEQHSEEGSWDRSSSSAHHNSTIPFTIGFLLGSSIANGVVFQTPLAPLAFRILSRGIKFEEPVEEMELSPADFSLLAPAQTAQVLQLLRQRPAEEVLESLGVDMAPLQADGALEYVATHLTEGLLWNVGRNKAQAQKFWAEVLRGLRSTSLSTSPLFTNCCARTLRNILCGRLDDPLQDFSFKQNFLLYYDWHATTRPYHDAIYRLTWMCLEDDFTPAQKRMLLRFITGQFLLPLRPKTEILQLTFHSSYDQSPEACDAALELRPTAEAKNNNLQIPNYLDYLLLGTKSQYRREHPERSWKVLKTWTEEDIGCAWLDLSDEGRADIGQRYREHLRVGLQTVLFQTQQQGSDVESLAESIGNLTIATDVVDGHKDSSTCSSPPRASSNQTRNASVVVNDAPKPLLVNERRPTATATFTAPVFILPEDDDNSSSSQDPEGYGVSPVEPSEAQSYPKHRRRQTSETEASCLAPVHALATAAFNEGSFQTPNNLCTTPPCLDTSAILDSLTPHGPCSPTERLPSIHTANSFRFPNSNASITTSNTSPNAQSGSPQTISVTPSSSITRDNTSGENTTTANLHFSPPHHPLAPVTTCESVVRSRESHNASPDLTEDGSSKPSEGSSQRSHTENGRLAPLSTSPSGNPLERSNSTHRGSATRRRSRLYRVVPVKCPDELLSVVTSEGLHGSLPHLSSNLSSSAGLFKRKDSLLQRPRPGKLADSSPIRSPKVAKLPSLVHSTKSK